MYLIRMLSWHGSPMANLLDMINYVLDHAELGTPHDEMPSVSFHLSTPLVNVLITSVDVRIG